MNMNQGVVETSLCNDSAHHLSVGLMCMNLYKYKCFTTSEAESGGMTPPHTSRSFGETQNPNPANY